MRKLLVPSLLVLAGCGNSGPITEPVEPTDVTTAAASDGRSYVTGYFALELDGYSCGLVRSVEGGDAEGEVVVEKTSAGSLTKKHIGNVKYNDFSVQLPLAPSPCTQWVSDLLAGKSTRHSGRVLGYNSTLTQTSAREFGNALITEVTLPALDAASKDAAYMTLKFSPEYVRNKKGDGSKVDSPITKGKPVLTSNFAVTIGKLPAARVKKVEALTIKQTVTTDSVGEFRDYAKEPGKLEIPNLKVTLSATDVDPWAEWHQSFVVAGKSGDTEELTGTIKFLDPTLKETLFTISFSGLGIFKLSPAPRPSNEDVSAVTAEMYVESMNMSFGSK